MNSDLLRSLIHAQLDGGITPERHAQLEDLLRGDWQARRLYLELADQHARLLQHPVVSTGRLHENPPPSRVPTRWLRAIVPTAAAAAVIFLAALLWRQPSPPVEHEATASGVAMLSQTLDAQFEQSPLLRGDAIVPGKIKLTQGLAQVDFFSGATVLIESRCEIEVISAWEARCLSGRVRVHVPPAAKGFLMHAPDMKIEDLGTEFALNVQDQSSAVHVFEGEVIAHTSQPPQSLKQGATLGSSTQEFLAVGELQTLIRQHQAERLASWQKTSEERSGDPRLIAYYPFNHSQSDLWDRTVNNLAKPSQKTRAGGAVGTRWTQGRWPGKDALEFKRPGDRVRLHLDGTWPALTLACWVKVDSVDKKYNSLLLTDGYDNGEPHWQIYEDGSLMFSVIYRPENVSSGPRRADWNQKYFSKPVFSADSLGRWHHIAVTYDSHSGEVIQYFDGAEVGREVSPLHQPDRPITLGACEIGNWGLPTQRHQFPIRNLNGAIDEFAIYSAALSTREVHELYQQGKPE